MDREDSARPSRPEERKSSRKGQQRSIETRRAILAAALTEFAERGFDGASTRGIGERANIDFTLIRYHFRNKDLLWRAVAEAAFSELYKGWDEITPPDPALSRKDRLRLDFKAYFQFTAANPAFHSFMLQAISGDRTRLEWLVENFLSKVINRVYPLLVDSQSSGDLIKGNPYLLYYMMLGSTSALYSLRGEISLISGLDVQDAAVSEEYWNIFERVFFRTAE